MAWGCCRRNRNGDQGQSGEPPPSYEGLTPDQMVHAAACSGDIGKLEELAAEGVDLDRPRDIDGYTALDACCWSGGSDGALALLRLGAKPARSIQAMVGAASWGHAELLEAMIKHGGPVNQELSDSTVLRWAVETNQEDSALVLLRHGAWELENQQEWLLRRLKRKGMARALEAVAEADPEWAAECVMPTGLAATCALL